MALKILEKLRKRIEAKNKGRGVSKPARRPDFPLPTAVDEDDMDDGMDIDEDPPETPNNVGGPPENPGPPEG